MVKTITTNRQARFNYQTIDTFLAGLVLLGNETKSVRNGNIDLKGSYVTISNGEAWLTNAHIKQYEFSASDSSYDPTRARKLLLTKRELQKLIAARQNGNTIVPLAIELHGKYLKVKVATARGKKLRDKREGIKKRDTDREIEREFKGRL